MHILNEWFWWICTLGLVCSTCYVCQVWVLHYSSTSLRIWLEHLPGKANACLNYEYSTPSKAAAISNPHIISLIFTQEKFAIKFFTQSVHFFHQFILFSHICLSNFLPPIKVDAKLQSADLWTEIPMSWMSTNLILLTCHFRYQEYKV